MRLLNCQIENFGKLHALSLDFQDGLNVFLRENGFGKSTLAAFIRVMFYGLSGERKAQDSDNERKKYRPWQGGSFGGSLCFALDDGKCYRITRHFGERKGQDQFMLYDAETNLPSKDYSERIGEELFRIDETSFRRTCFIGQQALETGVTSEINARIGNVSEDPEDMNRYAEVIEQLKDEINALSPARRTGAIFKKRLELEELKAGCAGREAEEQQAVDGAAALHQARETRQRLQSVLESTNRRLVQQSQQQDAIRDRMEYDRLCAARSESVTRLLEQERRYLGASFDELSGEQRAQQLQRELRRLQETFRSGLSSEAEMRGAEKRLGRIAWLADRIAGLEQQGGRRRRKASPQKSAQQARAFVGLLLSLLLLLLGVYCLLHFSGNIMPGVVLLGLAALALLLSAGRFVKSTGTKSDDQERMAAMQNMSVEFERLNQELNRFLGRFYPDMEYSAATDYLAVAEGDDAGGEDIDRRHPNRAALLRRLGTDMLAYSRLTDIRTSAIELSKRQEAQAAFEQSHDMEKLRAIRRPAEAAESLAALSRQMQTLRAQMEELDARIQQLSAAQETSERRLAELYEMERHAQQAIEELVAMEQRYHLLTLVRDHLTKARNDFTKQYMDPMMDAFTKYYRILANASDATLATTPDGTMPETTSPMPAPAGSAALVSSQATIPFRMDADFNVHLLAEGEERNTELLSAGYRNLVELARRMAFIDAMYEEEKPFILLDDPFINLDPPKVEGGMRFLEAIARDHQVLYFTCHESRK